jgi:hypothetical protein
MIEVQLMFMFLPAQRGRRLGEVGVCQGTDRPAWRAAIKTPIGDTRVVGTMSGDIVKALAHDDIRSDIRRKYATYNSSTSDLARLRLDLSSNGFTF